MLTAPSALEERYCVLRKACYLASMANDQIIEQTRALKDAAFREVMKTPEYIRYRALISALEAMGVATDAPQTSVISQLIARGAESGNSRRVSQADAALVLLRASGRPMSIAEIVEKLPSAGASVGGDNPEINASSSLSRDPRLRSIRLGGRAMWWITALPIPRPYDETEPVDFDDLLGSDSSSE